MELSPEVKKEIKNMLIGCAVCAVLVFVGFTVFAGFSLPTLFGCAVGYLIAVGNFYFTAIGVALSLETGEEAAAKKKLALSYGIRTAVILALLAGAILLDQNTGVIHWIPVAVGVFYVRIVLAARSVYSYFRLKKHPIPIDESAILPVEDEDEDEKEDGFDKFVGHFARGPIPGKEADNKDKTEEKSR